MQQDASGPDASLASDWVNDVQAHGTVLSCRVLYDHTSRSKQVAFVQMETHQQALKSIEALHSTQVERFSSALISQPSHGVLQGPAPPIRSA